MPPVATNRSKIIAIFAAFLSILILEATKLTNKDEDSYICYRFLTFDKYIIRVHSLKIVIQNIQNNKYSEVFWFHVNPLLIR